MFTLCSITTLAPRHHISWSRYENNDARLAALIDGDLDAAIVHFLVKEHPSIKLVGAALTQAFYGVVTRLGANALMDEIDMLLRDLKRSGKLNEIKKILEVKIPFKYRYAMEYNE